MNHKCGSGCQRKQNPSQQKDCPSCGSNALAKRRRYAQKVMNNPTAHWRRAPHWDVKDEWIERALLDKRLLRRFGEVP